MLVLPLSTSYLCEARFSALINIKTKYGNKLDVSNPLPLKESKIEVDAKAVVTTQDTSSYIFLMEIAFIVCNKRLKFDRAQS